MFWGKKKKDVEETEQKTLYVLELQLEGVDPQDIPIEADLIIGSSDKAHIAIDGADLIEEHALFKLQENILSLQNLSEEGSYIGDQKLQKDQMYVLNHGDVLQLGKATLIVKRIGEEKTIDDVETTTPETEQKAEIEKKPEPEEIPAPKAISKKEIKKKKEGTKPLKMKGFFSKGSSLTLDNGPGFFVRFYALITNLFIVYGLLYTFIPLVDPSGEVMKLSHQLADELMRQLQGMLAMPSEVKTLLDLVLPYYLTYCALEIFWAITLGLSFPLLLLGVHPDHSALGARIRGVIREILGIATTPFLIFDLPVLFGYKSLKEILSATTFSYGSRLLKYLGIAILLPLISIVSFFSPSLIHLDHFSTVNLDEMTTKEVETGTKKKKEAPAPETASETLTASPSQTATFTAVDVMWQVNSERFGVKTDLNFKSDTLILPWKDRGILIVNMNDEAVAELTLTGEIQFTGLLTNASEGNPLFFLFFPALSELEKTQGKKELISPDAEKEFHHLILGSQRLNKAMIDTDDPTQSLMNIGQFIIEYGPFLPGYLKVRDRFIEILGITQGATLSFLNQKNNNFIRVNLGPGKVRYTLLTSPESGHPSFEFMVRPPSKKVGQKILKQLLEGKWKLTPPSERNSTNQRKNLTQLEKENAFAVLDYLSFLKAQPTEALLERNNVTEFFRKQLTLLQNTPAESVCVKKYQESVQHFISEVKKMNLPSSPDLEMFLKELELLQKRELAVPTPEPTATPTPTPTPEPTPTPTPSPTPEVKKKLKRKGY